MGSSGDRAERCRQDGYCGRARQTVPAETEQTPEPERDDREPEEGDDEKEEDEEGIEESDNITSPMST